LMLAERVKTIHWHETSTRCYVVELLPGAAGCPAPDGICGPVGIQDFPLVCRVVPSVTWVAVDVPPETVAVTSTVSPTFTLAIPDSPPFTLAEEPTVKVPDVPSALFTVSDHVLPEVLLTAATVPERVSIVS